jgi:hypothetical protein
VDVKKRSESTAEQYKDAIKTITKKLKEKSEINKDIYLIENPKEIDDVLRKYYDIFRDENSDGHRHYSSALKNYREFLEYLDKQKDICVSADKIDDEINRIEYGLDKIEDPEKLTIIKSRIGQTRFRAGLLEKYKKCQLCSIDIEDLLVASHIKPWFKSAGEEKLDLNNGLLLCCLHDKLFDLGLISFNENGNIVIVDRIDKELYKDLNININTKIDVGAKTREYLNWHRENIFK